MTSEISVPTTTGGTNIAISTLNNVIIENPSNCGLNNLLLLEI